MLMKIRIAKKNKNVDKISFNNAMKNYLERNPHLILMSERDRTFDQMLKMDKESIIGKVNGIDDKFVYADVDEQYPNIVEGAKAYIRMLGKKEDKTIQVSKIVSIELG